MQVDILIAMFRICMTILFAFIVHISLAVVFLVPFRTLLYCLLGPNNLHDNGFVA